MKLLMNLKVSQTFRETLKVSDDTFDSFLVTFDERLLMKLKVSRNFRETLITKVSYETFDLNPKLWNFGTALLRSNVSVGHIERQRATEF